MARRGRTWIAATGLIDAADVAIAADVPIEAIR